MPEKNDETLMILPKYAKKTWIKFSWK